MLAAALAAALPWATVTFAAEPCPRTTTKLEWSPDCFETTARGRRVKPRYLGNIVANRYGTTTLMIDSPTSIPELVAVDRSGRVTVPGIYFVGDFDYPDTDGGDPGRYGAGTSTRTCGYFDVRRLQVVIPAIYDFCHPFHDGEAEVCIGCEYYCTDGDCHDSRFVGGSRLVLDRHNRVKHRLPPIEADSLCGAGQRLRPSPADAVVKYVRCEPRPGGDGPTTGDANPFALPRRGEGTR